MHAYNICTDRCYLSGATYKHQEQGQELQKQVGTITKQQKQIDALTAGLQKVSAQIELSKPAPQTAENNQ